MGDDDGSARSDADNAPMLKPICFMIMPFGRKRAELSNTELNEIDFDRLWELALRPAIQDLGYEAVRADADTGALIIQEMLERLAFAHLVIADLTTSNGNVYYEVGVRHGLPGGCVMISAEGSKQLFDVNQMRQLRYPLRKGDVDDANADEIRGHLAENLSAMIDAPGPFQQLGLDRRDGAYPRSFQTLLDSLIGFQSEVAAVRDAPSADRNGKVKDLLARYGAQRPILASVAVELVRLLNGVDLFSETLEFVARLPDEIRDMPYVREQRALALSRMGKDLEAIAELNALITKAGETSERQGLLGGRYKRLFEQADKAGAEADRKKYLRQAIEHYERGMLLDLNDYFPAVNLPGLLKIRGAPGDLMRAKAIAQLVVIACQAAIQRGRADEWTKVSLLVAAFDAEDPDRAETLEEDFLDETSNAKRRSTLKTLEVSLSQVVSADARARLARIYDRLAATLPSG
jgi:tetratricopeptide (TPR) repeat protein